MNVEDCRVQREFLFKDAPIGEWYIVLNEESKYINTLVMKVANPELMNTIDPNRLLYFGVTINGILIILDPNTAVEKIDTTLLLGRRPVDGYEE